MISEEEFAHEEARLGKAVHFHQGRWWVRTAPLYCKPVHEFRPLHRGEARPHALKSLLGYSYQVEDRRHASRFLGWNILHGEALRLFGLTAIGGKRRNMVRQGLRQCHATRLHPQDQIIEQMREINIQQARRFAEAGEAGTFLPAEYYEREKDRWRAGIERYFSHRGHEFIGAFAGEALAAYVDLIRIEDTWMFGAVKSRTDMLAHRPVDALYFTILSMAAASEECNRVVNGGPDGARESLVRFKEEYGLRVAQVPYFSRSLLPVDRVKLVARRLRPWRRSAQHEGAVQPCADSRDS